ncbi:MAG: hypothetical protein N2378_12440 [Chloroflexaceae bacterium]|nr:hypothetical protein [Chloroflexaceae bacterium]
MSDTFDDDLDYSAEAASFQIYGEYLYVEHPDGPRHIYRRVQPGARPHPLISSLVYAGTVYGLVLIEDDKE